jgi:hypothetical protein
MDYRVVRRLLERPEGNNELVEAFSMTRRLHQDLALEGLNEAQRGQTSFNRRIVGAASCNRSELAELRPRQTLGL